MTHEGPHWLHMSQFDRDYNLRMWKQAREDKNVNLLLHVARLEAIRLSELGRALRSAGFDDTECLPDEIRQVVRLRIAPASAQDGAA